MREAVPQPAEPLDAPSRSRIAARHAAPRSSPRASSGKLHSPPQTPTDGRLSSITSSPCRSTSIAVRRVGTVRRGRGAGRSATRFAATRRRSCAPGSGRTAGRARCRPSRRGPSAPGCTFRFARRHQRLGERPELLLDRALARETLDEEMAREHALTLPSRIAARAPNANPAIAAAVERPIPGSSLDVGEGARKPLRRAARRRAARRGGDCVPASNSRARSRAAAPRPRSPRRGWRYPGTVRGTAGSTARPSRPVSAAA